MRILKTTMLSTLLTASALAADKEISLDTSLLGSDSSDWNMVGGAPFSSRPTITPRKGRFSLL